MRKYRWVLMMVFISCELFVQAQELDAFPNFLDETYGGIKNERLNEITEMPRPEDCEDLAHWATFHLKDQMNQGRFDGMDSVAHLALEICPNLNLPAFYFYYSISQFLHSDFEGCIKSLHQAMPLVDEERFQYDQRIYMNLGSAHNNLTNLDSADYYYDLCYQAYGEADAPAIILNNLASVKMKLHHYNDALHYLTLAKAKLKPEEKNIKRMVLVNEIYILQNLRKTERAQVVFEQVFKDSILPIGGETEALDILLSYCLYYDDTTSFIQLFDRYADFLSDHRKNRLEVFKIIWTNYNLNNQVNPALWKTVKNGLEFGPYRGELLPSIVDQKLSRKYEQLRITAVVLSLVLLIVAIVLLRSYIKKNSAEKALQVMIEEVRKDFSQDRDVEVIREALEGRGSREKAIRALLDMDYKLSLQRTSTVYRGKIPWDLFDSSEAEVLKLIIEKKVTKEIAQLRNCSIGHIYNIKTRIRRKLELDDSPKAIERWLLQFDS